MQRVKYTFYIIMAVLFLSSGKLSAQNRQVDSLVRLGDSLRMEYRFEEACRAYEKAVDILEYDFADSLMIEAVSGKILLAENGLNMTGFAYTPKVVDRRKFPLEDFFLYFPLEDRSWRLAPNQLDSTSNVLSKALYAPSDAGRIYFSAEDQEGFRNIFMTELQDTVWTYPVTQNESVTMLSNEIYPMISADGRSLYFSSDGLYGVGGYDLYVSRWDDDLQGWSEPVNMGFPYSSPYDDFLYVSDESEGHVFFASNRECSSDSVWVYVLEYDSMPVRHSVEDPDELLKLSRLSVQEETSVPEKSDDAMPESAAKDRYMDKMAQVRALRDSVSYYSSLLDEERSRFALSNDDAERMRLAEVIREREAKVPVLQEDLNRTISELHEIEMEFLFSGVAVDPDKIMAAATEEAEAPEGYEFIRRSLGGPLCLDIMRPENEFDYTFMILKEGRFAEDNTIPDGIVYQIQIFSAGGKADVASLRGLSPVFEIRSDSGRYTYRVGLFNTFDDVQSKLDAVRSRGFRSAFIVAYVDGEETSVATARSLESGGAAEEAMYEVRIVPSEGVLDEAVTAGIRQHAAGKDIARTEAEDGTITFVVGPFDVKADADALAEFINASGSSEVSAEVVAIDAVNQ
ncbi:MAG: PD40 domain-containing protein [Bacteroidales bacterium]|nr:PD40 domain-containing protein [Bacteroidales bacterium]